MIKILIPVLALATLSAAPPAEPHEQADDAFEQADAERCSDTIHHVRENRGLPLLRRETAEPDEALLIAAVDHRIDECPVMIMYGDRDDIRPVPPPETGPVRLIPLQ